MLAPRSAPEDPIQTWHFIIGLEETPTNPNMILKGRCEIGGAQGTWEATVDEDEILGTIQLINFCPKLIPEKKIQEMIDVIIEEVVYGS